MTNLSAFRRFAGFVAALLAVAAIHVQAQTLPGLFRDHMVLQRGQAIPVWGRAAAGESVSVTLGEHTAKATADATGAWTVALPAMTAGGPHTLTVAGAKTITVNDVLIGDVWFCSGQSNMEWALNGADQEEVKTADYPKIRFFSVGNRQDAGPNDTIHGAWRVVSPGSPGGCTAVGYFFARTVHQASGVPIGILSSEWGGTNIEAWLSPAATAEMPELASVIQKRARLDAVYRKQIGPYLKQVAAWQADTQAALDAGTELPVMPGAPAHPGYAPGAPNSTPFNLYYGMVQPLLPYPIAGVLWYQGESNGNEGESYYHKLRALTAAYRSDWKRPDLPVYIVQLANFAPDIKTPAGGDGWSKLREAQLKFLTLPNTGMAVIIDIGETGDIHPRNKEDVGKRLAQWALRDVYGKADTVVSGPLFAKAEVEGGTIRVHFDHVGSGLIVGQKTGKELATEAKDGALQRFAIAGEDKVWHWATARIDGETVVVSSPDVPAPVAVRYAFSMNPLGANLYNREGLPASPFRSDDW